MSNSAHKSLVRVLLWWVTVLSISQVVLLVLFLTLGHSGQSHDKTDPVDATQTREQSGQQPTSEHGVFKMFTFKVMRVQSNGTITWYAENPKDLPTSDGESGILKLNKEDGYFFVCLRITLENCQEEGTVVDRVALLKNDEPILYGWINKQTCSTGLLCKMKRLESGCALKVKLQTKLSDSSKVRIDENQTMSYLQYFYVPT